MSRGYYKTCGRKVAPPPPTQSIQFSNVFCENSNKPSAAKSTGTLGKWGVASFTSIRSSSYTVGSRKSDGSYKRSRAEANKTNDAYSYTNDLPSDAPPKPKKFFKSRNTEENIPASQNSSSVKKFSNKRLVSKPAPVTVDKDIEEFGSNTSDKGSPPESSSHNPPIVLRIFKGTAQLLTEDTISPPKKEGRRRSLSSDSNEEGPRKGKHRLKDLEELRNDLENDDEEENGDRGEVVEEEEGQEENDEEAKEKEVVDDEPEEEEAEEVPPVTVNTFITNTTNFVHQQPPVINAYSEMETLEQENQELIEQGHQLLQATYADQDKVNQILDLSATGELKADAFADLDEPSDVPLDLHVPHVEEPVKVIIKKDDILMPSDDMKDDSNSDSDYSETMERPSVVRSAPSQPQPARKGFIFKSRQGEKRNAHYIHKWSDKDEAKQSVPAVPELKVVEGEFSETLTRVTNVKPDEFSEEPETFTSVTCNKNVKEFYTVVRNVKKAHQIQESGEFQEFNDDVEYILDALQDNNPIGTRCLSAITLASKCMVPAFRMHVRAHGTVAKFFKALHDASKDQSLGMCTATVMFVLSQDRLNMDLDRESLELMLSLLESDASSQAFDECGFSAALLAKTKDRVLSLCYEIKEQGHANHLNLDNITVGQLAMETLLSLTSKRAGEWFKEELRDLGGLEHIVGTILDTASCIEEGPSIVWTTTLLDRTRKLDRCLRVLENVTLNNEENSKYLLTSKNGAFVETALRVLGTCSSQLLLYPVVDSRDKSSVGAVLKDTLVSTLKILINITHDFSTNTCGPTMAEKKSILIDTSLHVLLIVPEFVPEEQKFDLTFMSLMLLINLVEHCEDNRKSMMEASAPPHPDVLFEEKRPALAALVTMFLQQEEQARNVERKTDAILEGENKPSVQSKSHEEFIEETVALLLQKAGRHMEYTLVAAYIATLLGYLTLNNKDFENIVRNYLPNQNFSTMVSILRKFYHFMTLTATSCSASNRGIKATDMLIKHLTSINSPVKEEEEEELVKPKLEVDNLFY